MDLLSAFEVIALGCASALCLYLIVVLVQVRSFLEDVHKDIRELASKAIPVFENLEVITERVKHVSESIEGQIDMVKSSIRSVKEMADSIVEFERRVQERIEEPVIQSATMVSAFYRGIKTFIERLRG